MIIRIASSMEQKPHYKILISLNFKDIVSALDYVITTTGRFEAICSLAGNCSDSELLDLVFFKVTFHMEVATWNL